MTHPHLSPTGTERAASGPLDQDALEAWGRQVGEWATAPRGPRPLVLALRGPVGAGKSVLARAVARGAGVEAPMPSPTFNLLFTYAARGGVQVHHLDLYRLDDPDDVWELGWEELGVGDQLVLVEWPERAEPLLPRDRWDVVLEFTDRRDSAADRFRHLRLASRGEPPPLPLPRPPQAGEAGP
jgi:tRNA threonylcarbamoyladenosine biosynthesis protein TsaE